MQILQLIGEAALLCETAYANPQLWNGPTAILFNSEIKDLASDIFAFRSQLELLSQSTDISWILASESFLR